MPLGLLTGASAKASSTSIRASGLGRWEWVWARATRGEGTGPGSAPASPGPSDSAWALPSGENLGAGSVQTHPVLAGLAWGPALASDARAPGSAPPEDAASDAAWSRAITVLAPVVASIGDRIFHFAVPLCLGAGLVVLGLHFPPWSVFWYPIVWALFILATAVWGWKVGLRGEAAVADLLASRRLERYAQALEAAGRFLLGEVFGWLLASVKTEDGGGALVGSCALLAALTAVAWRWGLSPRVRLGLLLLLGAAVTRWIG